MVFFGCEDVGLLWRHTVLFHISISVSTNCVIKITRAEEVEEEGDKNCQTEMYKNHEEERYWWEIKEVKKLHNNNPT